MCNPLGWESACLADKRSAGIWGVIAFPLFWGYHNILFGENANISALDGINRTEIPVMITHGVQDNVIAR
ncbi:MAG: hypothetical protein FWE83_11125 [Oscillospiraceae bacterium]|nr:hypothetical protein [Oscillospiraceae bacterium]